MPVDGSGTNPGAFDREKKNSAILICVFLNHIKHLEL